jgi:dihydroxyacid dehydratase/phosphogluconate dehydratase
MSEKNPPNKMKPRSGLVTDGMERAPARGMLRAVGMKDEDFLSLKLVLHPLGMKLHLVIYP